jgi:hypothetical protein
MEDKIEIQSLVNSLKRLIIDSQFISNNYDSDNDNSLKKLQRYVYGNQEDKEKSFYRLSKRFLKINSNNVIEILKASDLLNEVYLIEVPKIFNRYLDKSFDEIFEIKEISELKTFFNLQKDFNSIKGINKSLASKKTPPSITLSRIRIDLNKRILFKICLSIIAYRKITYSESSYSYAIKKINYGFKLSIQNTYQLFEELETEFIRCNYRDFENVVTGKEIIEPVKWIGKKSDLSYFLKALKKSQKITSKQPSFYGTISECFVDKNNQKFDTSKFRSQKPTKNKIKLDVIIKNSI